MLQMLHEVRDDRAEPISRWIPVRESDLVAPPPPFDFAGDRMVIVPRDADSGLLNKEEFGRMLRETLTRVVDDLDIS